MKRTRAIPDHIKLASLEIAEQYASGATFRTLQEKYRCPTADIAACLDLHGVRRRKRGGDTVGYKIRPVSRINCEAIGHECAIHDCGSCITCLLQHDVTVVAMQIGGRRTTEECEVMA